MRNTFAIESVNGQNKKVETVTYNNGRVVKRIYDKCNDIVPSDIVVVAIGRHVGPAPVADHEAIEHREVQLYKHHFNC